MKKKVFLCITFVGAVIILLSSCNNEEKECTKETEGITAKLILLDEDGQQTSKYEYGKDVVVLLVFQNDGDTIMHLPELGSLLGINLGFSEMRFLEVFRSDGVSMGRTYDYIGIETEQWSISPHDYIFWQSSWMGKKNTWPLFPVNRNNCLPEGKYYLQFNLFIDCEHPFLPYTLRADFEVV